MTAEEPMVAEQPVVELRDVTFGYSERPIMDGVSLTIPRGRVTAIMGPSGTGKTTLLRLIGGEILPRSGSVRVTDQEVPKLNRRDLFEMRKRLGMLFQSGALFTDLSVYDNVAFPLREHTRLSEALIRHLVLMKLEAVGLRGARDLMPAELSGGMARRAAMARAIALDPTLMLYDEPFTGQDPISMGILVKLIRELNDALGMTSIVVSHDVAETSSIADYVYLVSGGRVVDQGTPQALQEQGTEWTRQFMSGLPDGPVPFHYPADPFRDDLLTGTEARR
ncbi:MAG: ATP-binding cassette domain-containing protein [Pseudomonadota bacterium]